MDLIFKSKILTMCDAPASWQYGFQDPATPAMEGIIYFHNYIMFPLIVITVLVFWLMYRILFLFTEKSNEINKVENFSHHSILEIVWTILPAIVLVFLAIPSFALLYSLDELINPDMTLKVIGHQWYWSYEYSDYAMLYNDGKGLMFDSYMVSTNDLMPGALRLLEVDNRVVLPTNTHIRLLVTAADVLHSWAIPSFGIKVDACPGRLTQASLFIKREGLFFGQCSEICGVNHGFMPIAVKTLAADDFVSWIIAKFEGSSDSLALDSYVSWFNTK
jgi:cytochrome c oxidase subunit 2